VNIQAPQKARNLLTRWAIASPTSRALQNEG
jgi:hypothetical protein